MAKRSITHRWLVNSLGVMVTILLILEICIAYAVQNFYYSSARQVLNSKMETLINMLVSSESSTTANISNEIKSMVENFADKDKMELMVLDGNGRVKLTSSGFYVSNKDDFPDYISALDPDNSTQGEFIGKQANGEKVMAITRLLPVSGNEYAALRLVISMEAIDRQIYMLVGGVLVIFFLIVMFMLASGVYFIKSIVIPVRQIGATARKIAVGDFSVRVDKKSEDELGELCDVINNMADELANSEKIKNEFISSVSHELRTPLTAIKGWGETLLTLDPSETDTLKRGMKVIIGETERLSDMVEELLDFSRIQSGRFTLVKTSMDVLAEIGEAVLVYREKAAREGISIVYHEPQLLPFIFGDKNRLRQTFINIIDNAIKYSEPGGTVTVQAQADEQDIIISVSDTGCGIKEEDLPKVKTKFYKANLTRRGSGIGLAVAEEIITLHNGTLDIDSTFGEGTTVTIRLPINLKKNDVRPLSVKPAEERDEIVGK